MDMWSSGVVLSAIQYVLFTAIPQSQYARRLSVLGLVDQFTVKINFRCKICTSNDTNCKEIYAQSFQPVKFVIKDNLT